jgi:hypothetical protein
MIIYPLEQGTGTCKENCTNDADNELKENYQEKETFHNSHKRSGSF